VLGGVAPAAIRLARENAGLTQHQLARLVGVAGGERVSRWELGTSEPRPEVLVRLAKVLGVPPADLLDVPGEVPDLRALRFAAGLSAEQAAVRARVSKATYLRWETGRWKRSLGEKNVRDLARALKVSRSAALGALDRSRMLGGGHSPGA
jgi:transcriptional regulator with XRE-family HTH domain